MKIGILSKDFQLDWTLLESKTGSKCTQRMSLYFLIITCKVIYFFLNYWEYVRVIQTIENMLGLLLLFLLLLFLVVLGFYYWSHIPSSFCFGYFMDTVRLFDQASLDPQWPTCVSCITVVIMSPCPAYWLRWGCC
jgi:hypothetical protein